MPLSDDQKAMLRLLARDQSYEDIAALMGLGVNEVVSRAQGAVAQLESEGIPAPALPDAPAGSAPSPPQAAEQAPVPEVPPAPSPAPKEATAAVSSPPPPSKPAAPKKPRDKNMLIAIGGGAVGVIVIVVLAVLLISSSGGSDDGSTTASAGEDGTSAAQTTADGEALKPTMAVLKAVDGGDGSGTAVFGNLEEQLVLAIEAKGLEPTGKDTTYAICIAAGPNQILPVASTAVGAKGTIEASVQLPAELLLYLLNETYSEILITRADTARLTAEVKKQAKEPTYTGTPVLQGEITGSLVGNRALLKRVQEQKKSE